MNLLGYLWLIYSGYHIPNFIITVQTCVEDYDKNILAYYFFLKHGDVG